MAEDGESKRADGGSGVGGSSGEGVRSRGPAGKREAHLTIVRCDACGCGATAATLVEQLKAQYTNIEWHVTQKEPPVPVWVDPVIA